MTMPTEPAIETRELRKRFGTKDALSGLTLSVPRGSICGFLGRNGAGKTTTLKLLLGMAKASGGEGRVMGLRIGDARESTEIRRRTGYVAEDKLFPWSITVGELLHFTRAFYPRWRPDVAERYLQTFQLPLRASAGRLSQGMRSRLALLLALARGAELLLLDEPTEALDPSMAEATLQALVSLVAEEGTTVFFSSHQLANVEQIADHVCIIDEGRTVVSGSLDELKASYRRVHLVFDGDPPADGFEGARRAGRTLSLLARTNVDAVVARAQAANARAIDVQAVTLKDIFLESSKGSSDARSAALLTQGGSGGARGPSGPKLASGPSGPPEKGVPS
jgi:ABC-type multidrug transport system ATPase subunit